MGDKGSAALPYRPTGTVRRRDLAQKPTWYIRATHGGGYRYRLYEYTPGVNVTEPCFQQNPLAFLPDARLAFDNGTSLDL